MLILRTTYSFARNRKPYGYVFVKLQCSPVSSVYSYYYYSPNKDHMYVYMASAL